MDHQVGGLVAAGEYPEKFQPGAMISPESLPLYDSSSFAAPEMRLMAAALDEAIVCFTKYATAKQRRHQRLFRKTEQWLLAKDARWLFSFENLCGFLGINPSYLRGGLLQLKQQLQASGRGASARLSSGRHIRRTRNRVSAAPAIASLRSIRVRKSKRSGAKLRRSWKALRRGVGDDQRKSW